MAKLQLKPKEPKHRTRKCGVSTCRKPFEPRSITHKACCVECALALAEQLRAKADRIAKRAGLEKLKTRRDYLKTAQVAFNAFVRNRDELAGLPCVSCGRHHTGAYDAGHYRSVGAMSSLRFNESNCHRQCVPCNQHKSGNIVEYRLGLIARIGAKVVEWLELDHPPRKWSIDELKAITVTYRAKLKAFKELAK